MSANRPCSPFCRIGNPVGDEFGDPEHGGACDPRSERERARALRALLDAGVADEGIGTRVDAEARAAWGSFLVPGDVLDEALRTRATSRGWTKESGGPRWLHPDGGILPLL